VDALGAIVRTQSFDPYGNLLNSSGSTLTNYGFAGEWTDATGLQYLRARYYSPVTGGFLSRDTFSGSLNQPATLNAYSYAGGNPILYTDPSGKCPWCLAGIGIGAIAGGVTYALTNQGQCFDSFEFITAVAAGGIAGGLLSSGLVLLAAPTTGIVLSSIATAMIGSGTAAVISELEFMITNPDRFNSTPFLETAIISGTVGGGSAIVPMNGVGVAIKGLLYITGAEAQYALQTENWTVEGAQRAAILGTIGAGVDVGANSFINTTFRVNSSLSKEVWPSQLTKGLPWFTEILDEAALQRGQTGAADFVGSVFSGVGSALSSFLSTIAG
jgi:RHS repeat-associated protein